MFAVTPLRSGPMKTVFEVLRALAWVRRRSRAGAYVALLAMPAACTLALLLWRLSGRRDRMRLAYKEDDDSAAAVVKHLEPVRDYVPTPWMIVSLAPGAARSAWLGGLPSAGMSRPCA